MIDAGLIMEPGGYEVLWDFCLERGIIMPGISIHCSWLSDHPYPSLYDSRELCKARSETGRYNKLCYITSLSGMLRNPFSITLACNPLDGWASSSGKDGYHSSWE